MNTNPYAMNRGRYAKRVQTYLENFAAQEGVPVGDISARQIDEILDAIAEEIRREFKLSDADHLEYKNWIKREVFAPRLGKKGRA